jgi:hypothetical protein
MANTIRISIDKETMFILDESKNVWIQYKRTNIEINHTDNKIEMKKRFVESIKSKPNQE